MLVTKRSTRAYARREAGGKGWNLYRLTRAGFRVPDWAVVPSRAFGRYLEEEGLRDEVAGLVGRFAAGEASAEETEGAVRDLFAETLLPGALRAEVLSAYEVAGGGEVAVRSSAADEDSAGHSFAGQLSSFLHVEGPDAVCRAVRRCWASGFTARGLSYRQQNGLPVEGIRVATVVQAMVPAEKAGVLFTCDPVKESLDRFVVSAVYGLGEGLVSGALDADAYAVAAAGGEILERQVTTKEAAFRRLASGEVGPVPLAPDERERSVLSDPELRELHGLAARLLEWFGRPQDAEWALAGGELWLLQTRPVTTLRRSLTGYPNLWDNSNIVESYGGLTSPLTFSFALRNYRAVYVQFCEVLGLPVEVVRDMDDYLSNMLGCIRGRVFYNLYNWYKLVGVLPGFSMNRKFMETMMGASTLTEEISQRIRSHPSWSTWRGKLRRVVTGVSFFWYHLRIQSMVDRFLVAFHERYDHFRKIDYARKRSDEVVRIYRALEREMLRQWKAPIINDFLCMVHFGALRQLTQRWLTDLEPTIQNDLLAGDGHLESALPTKILIEMAADVERDPALRKLVDETPAADLHEALCGSEHRAFFGRVEDYLDRFGFRCMSEMKLEEIDLQTDPSFLFSCLQNVLRAGQTDRSEVEVRERALREGAEARVFSHLKGWRRWVYRFFVKHARKAVRNRENTRFARTRIYGVARAMFRAIGEDLAGEGAIEQPGDVFYLTVEEVLGAHEGTLPAPDLQGLVSLRRRAYESYETDEVRERFQTRGLVYWRSAVLEEEGDDAAPAPSPTVEGADLAGTPCCPGVVEGVVKVVSGPSDDLRLDGEILVAKRTDPGWVPLYPCVSGLLVERGSLLSHSAIVAREMGLPAIVSIPRLTKTLRSGMRVRMDGRQGTISILDDPAVPV